jgi:hypothetical protein
MALVGIALIVGLVFWLILLLTGRLGDRPVDMSQFQAHFDDYERDAAGEWHIRKRSTKSRRRVGEMTTLTPPKMWGGL